METQGVSASSSPAVATQTLRQKSGGDGDADDVGKVSGAQAAKGSSSAANTAASKVDTELAATQSVQDVKPTVNTSGQTTGTTINTTA